MNWFSLVMDDRRNPLRHLRPAQRFQAMLLLSLMWTTIFCAGAGAWFWYGELIVLHILICLGVLITSLTFHSASGVRSYRDHPADDGTPRYDDVWGA